MPRKGSRLASLAEADASLILASKTRSGKPDAVLKVTTSSAKPARSRVASTKGKTSSAKAPRLRRATCKNFKGHWSPHRGAAPDGISDYEWDKMFNRADSAVLRGLYKKHKMSYKGHTKAQHDFINPIKTSYRGKGITRQIALMDASLTKGRQYTSDDVIPLL